MGSGSGTSGNRKNCYKLFSFNTSVRNPLRNIVFLEAFKEWDGKTFDASCKTKFLFKLVKEGEYRFSRLDASVKAKIERDIPLTDAEVKKAFDENPTATGFSNRAVTQIRSLKDQGFIWFKKGGAKAEYQITKLGKDLLSGKYSQPDIYCKAMIGLHYYNPARVTMLNKSRPFLNTLFVIDEVNKMWKAMGNEPKGILKHEFYTFVLSMTDCDYKKAAKEIIDYRRKFGKKENDAFIKKYIANKCFDPITHATLYPRRETYRTYADEVCRKFVMTRLIRKHGKVKYIYIDHSVENRGKVELILEAYKDYKFDKFSSVEEYYDYLYNIKLPWEISQDAKIKSLKLKADYLGIDISGLTDIEQIERELNIASAKNAINKNVQLFSIEEIYKELLILSKDINIDSKYDEPEYIRLEFFTALLFAKKFGPQCVISNIEYDEDTGWPMSQAGGGKADIIIKHDDLHYIMEVTMIRNREQQYNYETSNLFRHMHDLESSTGIKYKMSLIAPYIHEDTCHYFRTCARGDGDLVAPLSISRCVEFCQLSNSVKDYSNIFDCLLEALIKTNPKDYIDFVNQKYFFYRRDISKFNICSSLIYLLSKFKEKDDNLIDYKQKYN